MDLKLNISSDDIERYVVESIVAAGIGKRVEASLASSLSTYSFGRAVDEAVLDAVRAIVREEVLGNEVTREKIREAMVDKLTDAHVEKLINIALKIDRD